MNHPESANRGQDATAGEDTPADGVNHPESANRSRDATAGEDTQPDGGTRRGPARRPAQAGPLTFNRLKWVSFTHSCVYTALLICAFAAGEPQPLTFILGLSHGLLWIMMSLACITAARFRVVSLRLAVAVAVLGGIGPFFGSYEFIREGRQAKLRNVP